MNASSPTYHVVNRAVRLIRPHRRRSAGRACTLVAAQRVTDAPNRSDQALWAAIMQLLSQVSNVDFDDVFVARIVVAPHAFDDGALRVDVARLLQEQVQQVELAWCEVYGQGTAAHVARRSVHPQVRKLERR